MNHCSLWTNCSHNRVCGVSKWMWEENSLEKNKRATSNKLLYIDSISRKKLCSRWEPMIRNLLHFSVDRMQAPDLRRRLIRFSALFCHRSSLSRFFLSSSSSSYFINRSNILLGRGYNIEHDVKNNVCEKRDASIAKRERWASDGESGWVRSERMKDGYETPCT